eukprot:538531-Alexandrium_andersonii.AAC.1
MRSPRRGTIGRPSGPKGAAAMGQRRFELFQVPSCSKRFQPALLSSSWQFVSLLPQGVAAPVSSFKRLKALQALTAPLP